MRYTEFHIDPGVETTTVEAYVGRLADDENPLWTLEVDLVTVGGAELDLSGETTLDLSHNSYKVRLAGRRSRTGDEDRELRISRRDRQQAIPVEQV